MKLSPGRYKMFFDGPSKCEKKPAVLSLIDGYSDTFIPALSKCPTILTTLNSTSAEQLTWEQLQEDCVKLGRSLVIDKDTVINIEQLSQQQSLCQRWYAFRRGRITTSLFFEVCHARLHPPPLSLLKHICGSPNALNAAPVKWGRQNEQAAQLAYHSTLQTSKQHSGLWVSVKYAFLCTLHDGIVECACCGRGIYEKVPLCSCKS